MTLKPYPHRNDSGIQQLGKIPAHWDMSRLGYEAWVRARLGWKGLKAEEYVESGYVLLATPNIKEREIDFSNVNFISQERWDESPEIQLDIGDVILAKDGSTLGIVNIVRELTCSATVNSSIAVITPGNRLLGLYLHYALQSSFIQATIQRLKGGMGVPHLFQDDIVRFPLPMPPLSEQGAIGAFLDRETAKIDALVAEQERLIALLAEKRRAVISHAVTKGLDPNAPMKDSGIAWLGEVPAHWEVKQLRRIVAAIEQGWSPECLSRPAEDLEWGVLKAGCTNGGLFSEQENKALPPELAPVIAYEVRPGDILMSRANGSPKFVGSTAYVSAVRARLLLSDKIYRVRLAPDEAPEWFVALMGATIMRDQIVQAISGAEGLANNLPQSSLKEFLVPVPPRDEQFAIAKHIAIQTAKLDTLTTAAERAIALLKERRAALISAAVTGKIDVREAVDVKEVAA